MIYRHEGYKHIKNYERPGGSLKELRDREKLNNLSNLAESTNPIRLDEKFDIERVGSRNSKEIERVKQRNSIISDTKELRESLLLNTLSEVFYNSLILDEEFKEDHKRQLKNVFCGEVAKLAETPEELLEFMKNSESSYLNEVAEEIKKKAGEDANAIAKNEKFKETAKEEKVDHPDSKDASNLIKEKVMQTIKKENELSKKEQTVQDDFSKAKEINESASLLYKGNGMRKFTLFKSIMMNTYKSSIKNALSENCNAIGNAIVTDDGVKVDDEKILGESIIKYTVMETLNTLRLKKFTPRSTQMIADNLAYKKIK